MAKFGRLQTPSSAAIYPPTAALLGLVQDGVFDTEFVAEAWILHLAAQGRVAVLQAM